VYNENTNLYDYFNFYSKIALTYTKARTLASELAEGRSLTYTESYLRPVKSKEEKIDHKASYYILFTTEHDNDDPIIFSSNADGDRYSIKDCLEGDRLSQVKHYFLYNNMTKLDMSSLEGDED
jgi:hypothetical protein